MVKSELKEVNVIRYLRPFTNTYDNKSNLGGITFVFHMNYETRLVGIKFSVCRDDENFNKKTGINTALESETVREINLDHFRNLADREGGFIDAYWETVLSAKVLNQTTSREKLLLKKLGDKYEHWRY